MPPPPRCAATTFAPPPRHAPLPPLQVRSHFRPEFVNRIDEFIVFQGLRREQIKSIVLLQARRVEKRLAEKKMKMELHDSGACGGWMGGWVVGL